MDVDDTLSFLDDSLDILYFFNGSHDMLSK